MCDFEVLTCIVHLSALVIRQFYVRHHICYRAYMLQQFCLSVSLYVTRIHCIQTAEHIIKILSLSDRPMILVFRDQGFLRKSDGFTPNGGTEYKGE